MLMYAYISEKSIFRVYYLHTKLTWVDIFIYKCLCREKTFFFHLFRKIMLNFILICSSCTQRFELCLFGIHSVQRAMLRVYIPGVCMLRLPFCFCFVWIGISFEFCSNRFVRVVSCVTVSWVSRNNNINAARRKLIFARKKLIQK